MVAILILWLAVGGGVCFYFADKKPGVWLFPLFAILTIPLYVGFMYLLACPPLKVKSETMYGMKQIYNENGTSYQTLDGFDVNLTRIFGLTFPDKSKFKVTIYDENFHGLKLFKSPVVRLRCYCLF